MERRGEQPCGEEFQISRTQFLFSEKIETSALAPLEVDFCQQLHELGGGPQAS